MKVLWVGKMSTSDFNWLRANSIICAFFKTNLQTHPTLIEKIIGHKFRSLDPKVFMDLPFLKVLIDNLGNFLHHLKVLKAL
jgi:hypothetical protein